METDYDDIEIVPSDDSNFYLEYRLYTQATDPQYQVCLLYTSGLPLLITLFAVGLAALIVVITLFCVLLVVGVSFLAAGVTGIFAGIYFLMSQTADGIVILGSSLALFGVGLLLLLAGILCFKAAIGGLARGMKRILTGGKKNE